MKWNDKRGYLTYQSALQSLKAQLGISNIDYTLRCELAPYITYILDYLNKRIILLGSTDLKIKLQEIFDIFELGTDKIVSGAVLDLVWELGIDTGDIYVDDEEIPYNQDRFVFSWSNIMTALVVRLKFQYAALLAQPESNECPCSNGCGHGQSTSDFESWQSGVYPEDEEYSYYAYNDTASLWRTDAEYPECTKCLRQ